MSRKGAEPILLWKDLDRAFCQLFGCLSTVPLLGYRWRGQYYFDLVMVMGCRIAPYICQRTTNMLAYLHQKLEYFIVNYVDDFLTVEYASRALQSHQTFIRLLDSLAVAGSTQKSVAPTQVIEFVGNLVDTANMSLGVTPQRKIDVLKELERWRHKPTCTSAQLEPLIGKLQFMSTVIRPRCLFVSRLLLEMKSMKRGAIIALVKNCGKTLNGGTYFCQASRVLEYFGCWMNNRWIGSCPLTRA